MQAYIDDSGTKGTGRVMVLAALFGPAESMAAVSDAWDRELFSKTPGRIAYFKEEEARNLDGEFRHWRHKARDEKVARLGKLIDRHDLLMIWYGVDLHAHKEAAKFAGKPFHDARRHGGNQPYLLLLDTLILGVGVAATMMRTTQKLELILDNHDVFRDDANAHYPVILKALPPQVRLIMPVQLWFRDDKDFAPLQAADLLAGHLRRVIEHDGKRPALSLKKLRVWQNSRFIDEADMFKFAQAHTRTRLIWRQKPD